VEERLFGEALEGRLTTFDVETALKGQVADEQVQVIHFRAKEGKLFAGGPLLASFRKTGRRLQIESVDGVKEKALVMEGTPRYLLFLKKRSDGKYEPVSGRIDSALSVRTLSQIDPLLETRSAASAEPSPLPPTEVLFSPKGGCTAAIIREVKAAKGSVLVHAYWFTSASIAKALVAAHKRGVKVEVILDRSRTEMDNEQADFIVQNDVPTFIDDKHTTAHNKVIVIDGNVVITGSFNFTDQAENENAENLLIIRDKGIAGKFTANWQAHVKHSGRYEKR
jgi:phosphatidylserine/phosphatidylglycerophosphate/cardiolipin synthase-like enzyme